jgi:hypothetical protein
MRRSNPELWVLSFAFWVLSCALVPASAQQLLDRVVARIGTEAVTQTDVLAAVELGLINVMSINDPEAARQTVERQLALREVARFPPVEPTIGAIQQQVAEMKEHAGPKLDEVMRATGIDEARLEVLARETLRIRSYIEQRFGASTQASDEDARKYYDEHRDQFVRNGMPIPFEEAAPEARQRASAERIRTAVTQWMRDLRVRADVVIVDEQKPAGSGRQ